MDHLAVTKRYYSRWLGIEDAFDRPGLCAASPERDRALPGYSRPFDLWALLREGRVWLTYGARAERWAQRLAKTPGEPRAAAAFLTELCGAAPVHSRKYVFSAPLAAAREARPLLPEDEPAFLAFFRSLHPFLTDDGWLTDYFADITREGLSCGVFREGRLISCTDLPEMPYMAEAVREIGINTLPEARRHGLALDACALTLRRILDAGLTPLWSTGADNLPSQRLAERLGFQPFGDCFALTLPTERSPRQ